MEALRRRGADAPEGFDGQLVDEGERPVRVNRAEAVGLSPIGGDLREKLVVGDARTCDEMQFRSDRLLDGLRNLHPEREARLVFRDVEKGLVDRNGFDHVGKTSENLVNLGRHGLVVAHASYDEEEVGA